MVIGRRERVLSFPVGGGGGFSASKEAAYLWSEQFLLA